MGFVPPSGIHSSQLCAQAVKPDEAPENPHVAQRKGSAAAAEQVGELRRKVGDAVRGMEALHR